jgi:ATP-binding cassette subfamily F protein 3
LLLLEVNNLSKNYGANSILQDVFLQVHKGEKIGIVGANGAGKTTLFRCILGLEEPDEGTIYINEGINVGYLQQNANWSTSGTIREEMLDAYTEILEVREKLNILAEQMSQSNIADDDLEKIMKEYGKLQEYFEGADGYNIEINMRRIARGLGFSEEDESRDAQSLSGGEKTRLLLAKLLLRKPDILLLDEPTNHLDINMVEWLEDFLTEYSGGVLVISHDRYFLDRVINKTCLIENQKGTIFPGNYSKHLVLYAEQQEANQTAFEKQQKWIEKTEAYIDRYRAGIKSKQARGRLSQLNRLERIAHPEERRALGELIFEPLGISGERVLDMSDISISFGARKILNDISLSLRKGEGVALIGPNGAGKTTLLKIATGQIKADSGQVRLGARVKIGYFSQHHEGLTLQNTILAEIMNEYGFTENVARKYLAVFLFFGDDVFKRIAELSGGERARIVMLKLLLSGANFLILDEPTNHLDIPSKEAFEEALQGYTGTFLVVSHDRYFLDRIVNRVLELEHGAVRDFLGDYTYYQMKKKENQALKNTDATSPIIKKETKPKREKAQKVNYAKLIAQVEKEIADLEEKIRELELTLNDQDVAFDYEKANLFSTQLAELNTMLYEKMDQWETFMACMSEESGG